MNSGRRWRKVSSTDNFVWALWKNPVRTICIDDPYSLVSYEEYTTFVKEQTLNWTNDEKNTMETIFKGIHAQISGLGYHVHLPSVVNVVKTTGKEEFASAYHRY